MKKIALFLSIVLFGMFAWCLAFADVVHTVAKEDGKFRIKYKHVIKDIEGKDRWMLSENSLKTDDDVDQQIANWTRRRNQANRMIKRFEDEKTAINALP